jgi:hypothetical protein
VQDIVHAIFVPFCMEFGDAGMVLAKIESDVD